MPDHLRDAILTAMEAALDAQLRAIRRLRAQSRRPARTAARPRMSQVDMAFDVLHRAASPLHVRDIIDRIEQDFAIRPDRESLVSALSKKIQRGDRFIRTARNTFSLLDPR